MAATATVAIVSTQFGLSAHCRNPLFPFARKGALSASPASEIADGAAAPIAGRSQPSRV